MSRKYSHSALKMAQRCLKKWSYRYVERLDPAEEPVYLQRGRDLHDALEHLYAGTIDTIWENLPTESGEIIENYVRYWEEEDKTWEVLHIEEDFEMKILDYTLVFKPDLVVRIGDDVWVVDHKTVQTIPEETDPYNMTDFQHLLYLEGMRQQGYENVRGFIFNYVRSKPPRQPELVKAGDRIADLRRIDTDYDSLRRFAETHGMLSFPDVQDRLKILKLTPNHFFQRHYIGINETAVGEAVNDTLEALQMLERAEEWETFPRHVQGGYAGSASCARCPYRSLCFADMTGMNRDIVLLDYVTREKREVK